MFEDVFGEYIKKYGLHDCIIDTINIENNGVHFDMLSGVYTLSSEGKELSKSSACKIFFEIGDFDKHKPWQHIQVTQTYKGQFHNVTLFSFLNRVEKYKFDISINYYSPFDNRILIKGYLDKGRYEIEISEINKIHFIF